ncbi:uncharacterized protein LOC122816736 [Protopterus annectens]|uniref:uncharacterized protein LOC122816736 n=1 Tax=Protopterus annectens TaxID=7888 RepID=UPI001CF9D091|nr:uncharacterized protein LOC122816736 [Protopterus annectens]
MDYFAGYMKLPFLIVLGLVISSNIAVSYQAIGHQLQHEILQEGTKRLIETYGSLIRKKRADPCPDGSQVTSSSIQDPLFPVMYPPEVLDACIDENTTVNNLLLLGQSAITKQQMLVLKSKLTKVYPGGLPDNVIAKLGTIATVYNDGEILQWNITSLQTFAAVLKASDEDSMAKAIISRYMQLGNPLNATVLDTINSINNGYVCLLDESQLSTISPQAIRTLSTPIDISTCTQPKKNILFNTSMNAFANVTNAVEKYNDVLPYIGGASADYLKALAQSSVVMDVSKFLTLNPNETQKLSVSDVQALLGNQLIALKNNQDNPAVKAWIQSQQQVELDKLGAGLIGGILDCPSDKQITSQNVGNPLLPGNYPAKLLDACLSNDTLKNNLSSLGEKAFSEEQMNVIKKRLSQLYPNGLPDDVLRNIGDIGAIYSLSDINSTWNINTPETLKTLLSFASTGERGKTIILKYLRAKTPVDAATLNVLNGYDYLCLLDEGQLSSIPPAAIRDAKPALNISTCTQSKKNILYGIASTAFADMRPYPANYYGHMQPYLSGASADNLRSLAQMNVSMDLPTFIGLNKDAVMNLTASDVIALLGNNLPDLQNFLDDQLVLTWLKKQNQSDLIRLGLYNSGLFPEPPIGYEIIPSQSAKNAASSSKMRFPYMIYVVLASIIVIPLL